MSIGMEARVTPGVEEEIEAIGRRLLAEVGDERGAVLARERWEGALLQRLMENPDFKVQALRFVDVLPALRDDAELVRHLNEYFGDEGLPLPGIARWGMQTAQRRGLLGSVAEHAAGAAVRRAIEQLGRQFIGGATAAEAARTVRGLWDDGMAFTLDVLGEATVSEAEAHAYLEKYLVLLDELSPRVSRWPERTLLEECGSDGSGPLPHPHVPTLPHCRVPRLNLSLKLSSLFSQLNPVAPEASAAAIKERLRPVLRRAKELGAAISLDMEQYDTKEITLRTFREVLMEPEFRDWPDCGIALQAYLKDTEADLVDLAEWARERGTPVTVRLVRGAYWDSETVIARQNGWPVPVFTEKAGTDLSYERCALRLLEAYPHLRPAIATHNVRSLAFAIAHARRLGLQPGQYEFQMLYGMADPLKQAVVRQGERLRVYVPFGELIPGMAYLVRRLLENTANESFLRIGFAEERPVEELLRAPSAESEREEGRKGGRELPEGAEPNGRNSSGSPFPPFPLSPFPPAVPAPFINEPTRRFTDPAEREAFAAALERVRGQLGGEYPLVIGGREVRTAETLESLNPTRPGEVVGRVASAGAAEAHQAVAAAGAAFPAWRDLAAARRAEILVRAAGILRGRRDELAAWQVFEVGKGWGEADADVAEAIDFLEYYAREALRWERGQPVLSPPGEANQLFYEPRGVAAIISPWNFPLAILTGMAGAALAAGNTVVMKPAHQSPVIAWQLMAALREAGLPAGVANFLPGPGAAAGEALVTHPDVPVIAFTGSRAVGTRILQLAAELRPGQTEIKRVILELGGKNAVIVDSDADVDDAVQGVVASAFGYQGQKCSACSRVIVLPPIYADFLRRLVEATRSLPLGPPEDPGSAIGPVIDAKARENIRKAIAAGRDVARPELEVDTTGLGDGYWVGPAVFSEVPPDSPLAQEEIFGPVLAVLRARDMDHALALANGTSYALTGGIYSRSPANIERARREFRVGNLYINRKITGAIVGRQPFGGFKLSGVGSKAGGPDYLLQFLEPRVVTENTLRRGFAPE